MISGINGFSASLNFDHTTNTINQGKLNHNNTINTTTNLSETEEKKVRRSVNEDMFKDKIEFNRNGKHLSGVSKDGRITIWGKAMGMDKTISDSEASKLMDFLQNTKIAGIDMLVDDTGATLLDSADISIEDFKKKWLENKDTLETKLKAENEAFWKEINEHNANIEKQVKEKKFKPIQATSKSVTYKEEVNKEMFLDFLRAEQEKGTDILDILQKLSKMGKVDISV